MTEDYKQGYREGFQDGVEAERRRRESESKHTVPGPYCARCGLKRPFPSVPCARTDCPYLAQAYTAQSDYYEYR